MFKGEKKQQHSLDLTTACVCSEVPEAILVKAHAASNCNEGLKKTLQITNNASHFILFYLALGEKLFCFFFFNYINVQNI